ncbi:MAG: methyltransferase domain-containing protein [Eubacterium sp.]|nr:methyltransferase domain-containing protein [Eubacterium sp.]
MISDKRIDKGKAFDWGNTSEEYAKYRNIYPSILYDRLRELGVGRDGSSWLDIGTGTGILPQNLYNEKAEITGVDISEKQILLARESAKKSERNINYLVSYAEATGLPDNSFDTITAAQCFWYFDRDKIKAEICRLLKPNGKLIKILLDWSYDDDYVLSSINLIKKYNPDWDVSKNALKDMYDDLFNARKTECFNCEIPFTRESWHGRMCACRGTLASMDKETFEKWSKEHTEMLKEYPNEFTVKHKLYITYFQL